MPGQWKGVGSTECGCGYGSVEPDAGLLLRGIIHLLLIRYGLREKRIHKRVLPVLSMQTGVAAHIHSLICFP